MSLSDVMAVMAGGYALATVGLTVATAISVWQRGESPTTKLLGDSAFVLACLWTVAAFAALAARGAGV